MALSREEGPSADRHDDRKREKGGKHNKNDSRNQRQAKHGENGVSEDGSAHDRNRGQKRKSYDQRGNEDRSKRQRTRSLSPDTAEHRRNGPIRSREPPKGPKGFVSAPGGQRGNQGGAQSGPRRQERDGMDVDRPHGKGRAKDEHPINRVTAAWIPDIQIEEDDELLQEVKKAMGFAGFKSSKNKKVPGNNKNYGVKKEKETQYRQYMNRVGGFNRPLSPSRD